MSHQSILLPLSFFNHGVYTICTDDIHFSSERPNVCAPPPSNDPLYRRHPLKFNPYSPCLPLSFCLLTRSEPKASTCCPVTRLMSVALTEVSWVIFSMQRKGLQMQGGGQGISTEDISEVCCYHHRRSLFGCSRRRLNVWRGSMFGMLWSVWSPLGCSSRR